MGGFFGGGGTVYSNFTGASTSVAGGTGLVPAPAAGKNTRYLSSDANFGEVPLWPKRKDNTANWKTPSNSAVGGSASSANPSTRVRIFGLGYFPDDGDINTLGLRIVAAPATAVNIHLGIWECGEDGLPSTYITGGTISSGITGNTDLSLSVTQTSVKRGYFFFAATYETGSGSCAGWAASSATLAGGIYGKQSTIQGTSFHPSYTATTYDQTSHGSFSVNSNTIPAVAFKYV